MERGTLTEQERKGIWTALPRILYGVVVFEFVPIPVLNDGGEDEREIAQVCYQWFFILEWRGLGVFSDCGRGRTARQVISRTMRLFLMREWKIMI